jgi:exodeoxyribonuclease VII large subunit
MQPGRYVELRRSQLNTLQVRIADRIRHALETSRQLVARREAELRLLSPLAVLQRGYSITQDAASGAVIRESGEVCSGQRLRTRLNRGTINSVAE